VKASLRKELRAQRRSMSAVLHRQHSKAAVKFIERLRMFHAGKRIALYLPFDGEVETAALISTARRRNIAVYVPVISSRRYARMRFHPLTGATHAAEFGISIPRRRLNWVAAQWLNLIVIPVVGVDAAGSRLGMGAGYYDRALAFRRRRRCWQGPYLVGLAFDCQRTDGKFADAWDVRLDSLATESGLEHFL
jgi:5-formyltetrahydrofolate cyclo-ligase